MAVSSGKFVRANGIDIHYVESGAGTPLVLLHPGLGSNNPVWAGVPSSYVARSEAFTKRFRVIAPDMRGHGKTVAVGPLTYSDCADDVLALIDALELDRPVLCGFSSGGSVATIAAIRRPDAIRALVNDAGYDVFNPDPAARVYVMSRTVFGGRPDATVPEPSAFEAFAVANGMGPFLERLRQDHVVAQGADGWKALVGAAFGALTTPAPYTFEDFRRITVPTLLVTGDRDQFCTVEEAVKAYRLLPAGELAVLPNVGHMLPDAAIAVSAEFASRVAS